MSKIANRTAAAAATLETPIAAGPTSGHRRQWFAGYLDAGAPISALAILFVHTLLEVAGPRGICPGWRLIIRRTRLTFAELRQVLDELDRHGVVELVELGRGRQASRYRLPAFEAWFAERQAAAEAARRVCETGRSVSQTGRSVSENQAGRAGEKSSNGAGLRDFGATPSTETNPLESNKDKGGLSGLIAGLGEPVVAELARALGPAPFNAWIVPLVFGGRRDGVLKLIAPTAAAADWVRGRYAGELARVTGARSVEVVTMPAAEAEATARRAQMHIAPSSSPGGGADGRRIADIGRQLDAWADRIEQASNGPPELLDAPATPPRPPAAWQPRIIPGGMAPPITKGKERMTNRDINTMSDAELVLEMLGMLGDPGNRNPFAPVPIGELAEQVAEFNEIQRDDDEPGRPIGELGAVLAELAQQGRVTLNVPAGTVALKAPPL